MQERIEFTREMKRDYTILMPNMLPVHFRLLRDVFRLHGYNMVLLDNEGPGVASRNKERFSVQKALRFTSLH